MGVGHQQGTWTQLELFERRGSVCHGLSGEGGTGAAACEEGQATTGRIDTAQAAVCLGEVMQTAEGHLRVLAPLDRSGMERPAPRRMWCWIVEESGCTPISPSDEQRLVQSPMSHEPIRQVCCVTIVEETAVCGPISTVVWEDGPVRPPPTRSISLPLGPEQMTRARTVAE